jgi:lysophospholipase L1-like esterase
MTSLRIFFLFLPILVFACNNDDTLNLPVITPTPIDSTALQYLALGDSYTIGQQVEIYERFPVQLVDSLRNRGHNMRDAYITARTGWTTRDLQTAIANENFTTTFDLVSLCTGVNNQFQGQTAEQYRQPFRDLLEQAIALAGGDTSKVFVLSIPDYGVTDFAANMNPPQIAQEIDLFNAINAEIADSLNVTYFDVTPISRQAANDPTLIANDGLHPSGRMYRLWVELMLDEVEKKVE